MHAHFPFPGRDGGLGISDDGFHARYDGRVIHAAEADEEGRFFLQLSRSNDYVLHAEAPGWARAELGTIRYAEGANVEGAELELVRGGAIEGRVLTAPGVEPRGTIVGVGCGDTHELTLEVGEDGSFRFEGLTPGRWQVLSCDPQLLRRLKSGTYLYAEPDAPVEWSCEVRSGETTLHDLDLRDRVPCRLRGQLTIDDSAPVAWQSSLVRLDDQGGWNGDALDSLGRFDLDSSAPGAHSLGLTGPRSGPVRYWIHQNLELFGGANDWALDLATGSLTIENMPELEPIDEFRGEPPHYCLVWHGPEGAIWRGSIYSAAAGPLTIPQVPAGQVRLVRRPEGQEEGWPDDDWPLVLEAALRAGAETRVALP